ncbi:MAG: DUF5110 domain-containing protein [Bacteroidetes bacterium]|nr:DUF5110 domain-containing protein [Bacteroidota bacterium]
MIRYQALWKVTIVSIVFLGFHFHLQAQNEGNQIFWKETFDSSHLPVGWDIPKVGNWDPQWILTNQPYPGSYKYQQQAPPIASKSRGYHLQFQAGYFTDEDVNNWIKKKNYPDGFIISPAINCSGKSSVILKFQQTFRWWDYGMSDSAGLFVGISTDKIHWQNFDVRDQVKSGTDMFTPMNEEINISKWAANQSQVYIRFFWKGMMGWYWMVDDISLSEGFSKDIAFTNLISQTEKGNVFTSKDSLKVGLKNTGTTSIKSDIVVNLLLDSLQTFTQKLKTSNKNLLPGEERYITFKNIDLSKLPTHQVEFTATMKGDENLSNNFLKIPINAAETRLGKMDVFNHDKNEAFIKSGVSALKVIFYTPEIFRIWLAPDGKFEDPAGKDIVDFQPGEPPSIKVEDAGSYYQMQSEKCILRIYKNPIRFALYDLSNTHQIFEEMVPLTFGDYTTQTMRRGASEYFYGGGMQNGYFSHRGKTILIEKGGGWDDGGRSNPAPFYMSTNGYGVFRNTFDAGKYAFTDTLKFEHAENRFDAWYFYGPSLKEILNDYTLITGRPFLMPRWALSLGDANCYNKLDRQKKPQTTPAVISTVADQYIKYNFPRGWILPNDGYGCGYTHLDSVVKELAKRGFKTGLWTENGLDKIATEVGQYGTRLCKLDVAWVGPGYRFALNACKAAYTGIENNSNARGFVWSVMGWSGTQRYSTIWSGDQSGNWEYIRFHIPTVIGAGLSGFNAATGDVDGIFGGSDSTYTRDLEWKCFTPVLMVMNGWAKKDKQPYISDEPFRSINRKYLDLKMRLTPYMYTLCENAYATGVPASRAMVLEFPEDTVTYGTKTQYQFMNGEWLLVAPVYKSEGKRDSIYLPEGKWFDYWNGKMYEGARWLNHFDAPLDKLPVFVKNGAILPMYPLMDFDGQRKADTLTLEIYPFKKSSFQLYEDDGITREHRYGAYAKTLIEVNAEKNITVTIDKAFGSYTGMYDRRVYLLEIHTQQPVNVNLNKNEIQKYASLESFRDATEPGYFYDSQEKGGTLYVITPYLSTAQKQTIEAQF